MCTDDRLAYSPAPVWCVQEGILLNGEIAREILLR